MTMPRILYNGKKYFVDFKLKQMISIQSPQETINY
jgi:hypothetical protein